MDDFDTIEDIKAKKKAKKADFKTAINKKNLSSFEMDELFC